MKSAKKNQAYLALRRKLFNIGTLSDGLQARWSRFDSRQGQEILLFSAASREALGSTEPPTQRLPRDLSPVIYWQGCEADRSPQSSAEVKNGGSIPPLSHTSS
jgi:hypothetical protein